MRHSLFAKFQKAPVPQRGGRGPTQGGVARTERRRSRGRIERKSKERGTASVTPRTGRKTGTVTEGTSRSIKEWIGLGPPPEPDVRATALKRAACASQRGRRKSQPVRGGGASSSTGALSPPFIFLYLWAAAVILFSTSLID